jgi:hypothetical protein
LTSGGRGLILPYVFLTILVGKTGGAQMNAEKFAVGSLSSDAFQRVKWALSVIGALAAFLLVAVLETQA